MNKSRWESQVKTLNLNLLLPKVVVFVLLSVFFVNQIQLYFSTPETLSQMGYSNSQYAREVFAQLLAVTAIILVLIFNDSGTARINKLASFALIIFGFFLIAMAFKSDYEYSTLWGFTYKRLYGFAAATLLLGIFVILVKNFKNSFDRTSFIKQTITLAGVILVFINFLNFDYLIYNFRKSTTGEGTDYYYLSGLSPDSLSYKQQLNELLSISEPYPRGDFLNSRTAPSLYSLTHKIEYLQNKYKNFDIRSFNFLEFKQYLEVKDVNLEPIKSKYLDFKPVNI